jgi:asparagine synthase (glutamine-hydrolysing)
MCGICGEVTFAGNRVLAENIIRMRESLVHRGPDAAGLYVSPSGSAGLGFRRLGIIDLTAQANQPLANEDGSVQVVFNGEVYNYRELRRDLERRHHFRSESDTEVIVHLYEEKGADAIADLDGMFALAIWDESKRDLLLARDRAGKKPLFVMDTADRLVFASEIKALFQHSELRIDPDPSVFPSYFLYGYVPSPQTFYRDVRQVEPATVVTVSLGGNRSARTYWRLPYPADGGPGHTEPQPAVKLRVRELVECAVERRLVSDVPLGAFLSGGVDSTIVVGVMSRLMASPVKTFSIGFAGGPAFDETRYARAAAQQFRTDHTEFQVVPSAIGLVEQLVWHHDGPFADASAIPTFIISKLTREHVTVALTGDGGDELFGGYTRLVAATVAERVPPPIRRLLARGLQLLPHTANDRTLIAQGKRFGRALDLPLFERMTRWISLFYEDLERLFDPTFLASVAPIDRLRYLRLYEQELAGLSTLGQLLYSNYRSYLQNDLLVKMDRCSMANSLEVRSPFLDRELTEYVAGLPDRMKIRGRGTKVILKTAFADLLSRSCVASLVDAHVSGRANLGLQLWTLLTFEVWLRAVTHWRRPIQVAAGVS